MTYGYNRDTDYSALIADAVANGDYASAAIYEAQRNEKIAGEGLQYEQTNQYASYLPSSYTNPYTDALNDAIANLQDDSAFKKRYLQEADRTMHDALGQYGTMTGGLPSTQAVAAASQAADYYKSQLDEKLYEHNRQNANLLLSAGSQAQSEYQMMISEALTRWSQLGYADEHVAQILGVNVGTPTSDQSYINWQQGQQEQSEAYNMAMMLLQAGQMPGADTLAAAGISAEDAQTLLNAYTTPRYSGGGGENPTGRPLTDEMWQEFNSLYQSAVATGDWTAFNEATYMSQWQGYDVAPFYGYLYGLYGEDPFAGPPEGGYTGNNGANAGGTGGRETGPNVRIPQ